MLAGSLSSTCWRKWAVSGSASASRIFVSTHTTGLPALMTRCRNCVGTSSLYRSSDATYTTTSASATTSISRDT